jgi:ubiquinone/menaquinone biosynthesis C-methylase UbiE
VTVDMTGHAHEHTETAVIPERLLACLKAPGKPDDHGLEIVDGGFRDVVDGEIYPLLEDIPSLMPKTIGDRDAKTGTVRDFYEANPFPSYEGLEEFGELVAKGSSNPFSAQLLDAIGFNKLVLECGCGTGQLSHFLQLNNNNVLGVDMTLASLALAVEHRRRNGLARSAFCQMNVFDLAIRDNSFDVVISHGVLHHTPDARAAFASIVRKVKPGGIMMVGLYNRYARIPTWIRSHLIGLFGNRIDPVVRERISDPRKAAIWIADQYRNPLETWHSLDEVLGWFEENDVAYLNATPPILNTSGETAENLFDSTNSGTAYQRIVTQLGWLGTIAREGALFDVIGKRRG